VNLDTRTMSSSFEQSFADLIFLEPAALSGDAVQLLALACLPLRAAALDWMTASAYERLAASDHSTPEADVDPPTNAADSSSLKSIVSTSAAVSAVASCPAGGLAEWSFSPT
jgi:hypothetical protein